MTVDHSIAQRLDVDVGRLTTLCIRHGVFRLSLFGSALRIALQDATDIDLLVEYLPDRRPSLLDLGGLLMDLRELLGREVDLRTPKDLSRYFRDDVLREARPLYAA